MKWVIAGTSLGSWFTYLMYALTHAKCSEIISAVFGVTMIVASVCSVLHNYHIKRQVNLRAATIEK